jgi:hypothetical protein
VVPSLPHCRAHMEVVYRVDRGGSLWYVSGAEGVLAQHSAEPCGPQPEMGLLPVQAQQLEKQRGC